MIHDSRLFSRGPGTITRKRENNIPAGFPLFTCDCTDAVLQSLCGIVRGPRQLSRRLCSRVSNRPIRG